MGIDIEGGNAGGGGGGGVGTLTVQTYGALPGSPAAGDVVVFSDCPFTLVYSGSAWVPLYDPCNIQYFIDNSYLDFTYSIERFARSTMPAADTEVSGVWTRSEGMVQGKGAAGAAHSCYSWNLGGVRTKVLLIARHRAAAAGDYTNGIFISEGLNANLYDEGYNFGLDVGTGAWLQKETGGAWSDITSNAYFGRLSVARDDHFMPIALHVNGTTVTGFAAVGGVPQWNMIVQGADASCTDFQKYGLRQYAASTNYSYWSCPVICFAKA